MLYGAPLLGISIFVSVVLPDAGIGGQYEYFLDGDHAPGQCIYDDFQPGVWYDFVHHIRWSNNYTGRHEIWMRKAGGAVRLSN